jgi:hypothetical protein
MAASVEAFLDALKGVVEGIDPNIGSVFTTQKRWPGLNEVKTDAGLLISASGLMDDSSFIGKDLTRFWVMNPQIKTSPLTYGSYEARIVVMIWVFYSRLEDDTQEKALQKAIWEFVDAVSSKTVELTTLNVSAGYMGFLGEYPEITVPIQSAVLDEGGVNGHAAQLKVVYNEEVSRT